MTADPRYLAGHERQTVGGTLNISIKRILVTLDMHANPSLLPWEFWSAPWKYDNKDVIHPSTFSRLSTECEA